jgi:hypothetical protein
MEQHAHGFFGRENNAPVLFALRELLVVEEREVTNVEREDRSLLRCGIGQLLSVGGG